MIESYLRRIDPSKTLFLQSEVRTLKQDLLGVFLDTMVICSLTAFAVLVTGAWTEGTSTAMAIRAASICFRCFLQRCEAFLSRRR